MSTLTPTQAAVLARGVYKLRENSVSDMRDRGQTLGCEGMFTVDDGSRFQGRSGALAWKRLSGFGYMAAGEGASPGAPTPALAARLGQGTGTRREARLS